MRFYWHPSAYWKQGQLICTECGAVLDNQMRSSIPCRVPSSSAELAGEFLWFINVHNCRADLVAQDAQGRYYDYECADEELAQELEKQVYQTVNEQGSITWSGIYSVSDNLLGLISETLATGRLKLKR